MLRRGGGYPLSAAFPHPLPPLPPAVSYHPSVPPKWHVPAFWVSAGLAMVPASCRLSCRWVSTPPLVSTSCGPTPICLTLEWRAANQQISFPPVSSSEVWADVAIGASCAQGTTRVPSGRLRTVTLRPWDVYICASGPGRPCSGRSGSQIQGFIPSVTVIPSPALQPPTPSDPCATPAVAEGSAPQDLLGLPLPPPMQSPGTVPSCTYSLGPSWSLL